MLLEYVLHTKLPACHSSITQVPGTAIDVVPFSITKELHKSFHSRVFIGRVLVQTKWNKS